MVVHKYMSMFMHKYMYTLMHMVVHMPMIMHMHMPNLNPMPNQMPMPNRCASPIPTLRPCEATDKTSDGLLQTHHKEGHSEGHRARRHSPHFTTGQWQHGTGCQCHNKR